ncbi:MAG: M28 family peptidase [Phycisphaerae bacterium]
MIAAHYDKIGEESQGIIDNACGVVVVASVARFMKATEPDLTYFFLFYGAEEQGGRSWTHWLLELSELRVPIKYAIHVEGGGLIGAEQTFRLEQRRPPQGWLHWRFPELRVNETGGSVDYLKHTAKDNINVCDFSRLVKSQNVLLEIILAIEKNI